MARIAHVRAESLKKIRRALNKNYRSHEDINFINGDSVYFRRNKFSKWQGPASIIGQDDNLVLVRQQSTWLTVHPCNLQLITTGESYSEGIKGINKFITNLNEKERVEKMK